MAKSLKTLKTKLKKARLKAAKQKTKSKSNGKKGEPDFLLALDPLFRTPPGDKRAIDGSRVMYTLQHRMGRAGGVYTKAQLMVRTGLEKMYWSKVMAQEKKMSDAALNEYLDLQRDRAERLLTKYLGKYRDFLNKFYADDEIEVMMQYISIDDKRENDIIFIQGFVELGGDTIKLAVDVADVIAALESFNAGTKGIRDRYERNRRIARRTLSLPGVNRDLKERCKLIDKNAVTNKLLRQRNAS